MIEQTAAPATREPGPSDGDRERASWRVARIVDRPSADDRNLPDRFPFGWFVAAYSDEVGIGQVVPLRYFGEELVLWRGEDGQARILDAYCVHYGAHMGHGGKVRGNRLECPFHAWRYEGDGSVAEIPYARAIPPQARRAGCVRSWPTVERNGFVWIWYHPDRAAPAWEVEPLAEVGDPGWTAFNRFEWNIHCALENMADNNVDISHFKFVHGAPTIPDYEIGFEGIRRTVLARIVFTTPRGPVNGTIESVTHGPGQGWVRFQGLLDTLLLTGLTPVDRDLLKVRFAFIQPQAQANGAQAGLARALVADICQQLDQDKAILDHYRRRSPPLICDGDGPFGRNRVYYSQFFVDGAGAPGK